MFRPPTVMRGQGRNRGSRAPGRLALRKECWPGGALLASAAGWAGVPAAAGVRVQLQPNAGRSVVGKMRAQPRAVPLRRGVRALAQGTVMEWTCIHHGNRLAPAVVRQCYLANHRMAQRLVLSSTHRPVLMIGPPPCPSGGGEARGSASVNCSVYGSHRRIATCSTARGQIYLGNTTQESASRQWFAPFRRSRRQARPRPSCAIGRSWVSVAPRARTGGSRL